MEHKEIEKINGERKVVQGNPLLELGYSMPQLPARIMRVIIAHIDDARDQHIPRFTFSKRELGKALGLVSHEKVAEDIRNALSTLRNREISFIQNPETEEEAMISTGWVLKSRVFNYQDRVDIWMDGELSPYLLDLKKRFYDTGQTFSKYRLEEVLSFRGEYSIRFFEWFNAQRFHGKKSKSGSWYIPEIALSELRRRLGHLDEKGEITKFQRWPDFRRFVLDPATEEISEKSDFIVNWEVTSKKGKAVKGITFYCFPKNKKQEQIYIADVTVNDAKKSFETLPWRKS